LLNTQTALDGMSDSEFVAFRKDFGGDFATRQQYVDDFVHHPEHDRGFSQLLGLTTEEDKRTLSGTDALKFAKEANRIAEDANAHSASANLTARHANMIARRSTGISLLALALSIATLIMQALCNSRHAG
jgi:hypothetical protein